MLQNYNFKLNNINNIFKTNKKKNKHHNNVAAAFGTGRVWKTSITDHSDGK